MKFFIGKEAVGINVNLLKGVTNLDNFSLSKNKGNREERGTLVETLFSNAKICNDLRSPRGANAASECLEGWRLDSDPNKNLVRAASFPT